MELSAGAASCRHAPPSRANHSRACGCARAFRGRRRGLGATPAEGAAAPRAPSCVPAHLNGSAQLGGTPLAASPLPGSRDASPQTQISLLGAPSSAIAGVRVSGSRSGSHPGALRAYSQGDGASFVPSRPFAAGETVSVTGRVAASGAARRFSYSFVVGEGDYVRRRYYPHPNRDPNEKQHFASQPTLEPPLVTVTARSPATAPGYLFAAPYAGPGKAGPMIFDETGSLVWFDPLPSGVEASNLQVQTLDGNPVLTWWQGYIAPQGFGEGEEVIADSSYRQVGRVRAGNGYLADLHDFHITAQDTALLTAFHPLSCNLSSAGGSSASDVTDSLFQELDLRTGLVRREWHSLDHVAFGSSYFSARGPSAEWPFDYFHLNSIEQGSEGRTLISARNTWALYELNTLTGQVLTTIGGRHSDVKLGPGAATAFQHDASRLAGGAIAIFDNGAVPKVHPQSRGVLLSVSPASRTATTLTQFVHPTPLLAGSQGNLQALPNSDVFIGWGSAGYFSEFSPSGQLLFDAHMHGSYQSYRAYRFPWTGAPNSAPAVVASASTGPPSCARAGTAIRAPPPGGCSAGPRPNSSRPSPVRPAPASRRRSRRRALRPTSRRRRSTARAT